MPDNLSERVAPAELGIHQKRFSAHILPLCILAAIGVVCAGVAIWVGFQSTGNFIAPTDEMEAANSTIRKDKMSTGMLIVGINLVIAIGSLAAAWLWRSKWVDIYELGFVANRGLQRQTAKWSQVESVLEHSPPSTGTGRRFISIHTSDNRDIEIAGLHQVQQIGETIAKKSSRVLKKAVN